MQTSIKTCLTIAAATACCGVGLLAMLGDWPARAVLWDQDWANWLARLLGFSWTEWVTSAGVDQKIELLGFVSGLLLLHFGIFLGIGFTPRKRWLVYGATFFLLLRHFLLWKDHFWQLGYLLEMSLLTTAPLLLWWTYRRGFPARWVAVLIAATFVGHGMYAVGLHPVPAHFVMMTQEGLGVNEASARGLLLVVGVLDFIAAGLLLLPAPRAWLAGLSWIIPWAILTTLARTWSYGGLVEFDTLLMRWLPQTIVRLPHVFVPLAFFFWAPR